MGTRNFITHRRIVSGAAIAVVLAAACVAITACAFIPPEEEEAEVIDSGARTIVWQDEFDSGSVPDPASWVYELGAGGWGNNEKQTYTNSSANAYVSDGTLKIKSIKDANGAWTSARIKTSGKHSWKYGYVEARIKVPATHGVWPAFWMMPETSAYGSWPKSGEIDIMEYSPFIVGDNHVFGTVHYGDSFENHKYTSLANVVVDTATTEFHTYGVEWTAESITQFIDGAQVGNPYMINGDWTTWPFDQNFFVILNLAMGGNLGGPIDAALTEAVYEIDYVRVYR